MIIDGTTAKPVPLSFMFNNFWITLQPEEFLSDVSNAGDGSALLVMIIQNQYNFFLMGQPIMQNYYMTFSMENTTMSVIPNAWTKKTPLVAGATPSTPISKVKQATTFTRKLVGIAFLIAMAALYYFLLGPLVAKQVTNLTYGYVI